MKDKPLVTVIIPSYNHAQYISSAIESVLNQTYEKLELIIVDDCSRDKSKEIILQYAEDPRVKAIFKEINGGQSHSINIALNMAQGKYISFLPSDDWYLPEKTALQVEKFESLPPRVGVVYGRGQRFFEDTHQLIDIHLPMRKGDVLKYLVAEGNFVYPITPMFRRSTLDQVVFDESYSAEGEAVYIKIARAFEFDYVDEVVGVMRGHSYNTGSAYELMYADNVRWWSEFFSDGTLPKEISNLKKSVLGRIHRLYGLSLITNRNNYIDGRKALTKALIERPAYILDEKVVAGFCLTFIPETLANRISHWKTTRSS